MTDHVGQVINDIRKAKNMPLTQLLTYSGLNRATYYRFVKGDADIEITDFYHLVYGLGLTETELAELIIPEDTTFRLLAERIKQLSVTDHDGGAVIQAEIQQLQEQTGYRHYGWLTWMLYFRQNTDRDDEKQRQATVVFTELLALPFWTRYELELTQCALPYLSSEITVPVLKKIVKINVRSRFFSTRHHELKINILIFNLLQRVASGHDSRLFVSALRSIVQRFTFATNYSALIYIKFIQLLLARYDGACDESAYTTAVAELLADIDYFYSDGEIKTFKSQFAWFEKMTFAKD